MVHIHTWPTYVTRGQRTNYVGWKINAELCPKCRLCNITPSSGRTTKHKTTSSSFLVITVEGKAPGALKPPRLPAGFSRSPCANPHTLHVSLLTIWRVLVSRSDSESQRGRRKKEPVCSAVSTQIIFSRHQRAALSKTAQACREAPHGLARVPPRGCATFQLFNFAGESQTSAYARPRERCVGWPTINHQQQRSMTLRSDLPPPAE